MMATPAILIVAGTLYMEAANQPPEGIARVADVIYNRTRQPPGRPAWAECLRYKQFSCWNDRHTNIFEPPVPSNPKWELCLSLARQIHEGTFVPLSQATHYHATGVLPDWAGSLTRIGQVGDHIFYHA